MLFIHQVHLPAGVKSGTQEISSAFLVKSSMPCEQEHENMHIKTSRTRVSLRSNDSPEHDIKEKNHYQNGGIIITHGNF
jgi:hypothetical protein